MQRKLRSELFIWLINTKGPKQLYWGCILRILSRAFSDKSVNIDASEASTFSSLSTRWWDKSGEFKLLHAMNPLRLEVVNNLFKDESPKPWYPLYGKRILDIGCGGGILSEVICFFPIRLKILTYCHCSLFSRFILALKSAWGKSFGY